jgi:hypothetical protein
LAEDRSVGVTYGRKGLEGEGGVEDVAVVAIFSASEPAV